MLIKTQMKKERIQKLVSKRYQAWENIDPKTRCLNATKISKKDSKPGKVAKILRPSIYESTTISREAKKAVCFRRRETRSSSTFIRNKEEKLSMSSEKFHQAPDY